METTVTIERIKGQDEFEEILSSHEILRENLKRRPQRKPAPRIFTEYKCDTCGKVCDNKAGLRNHERIHSNVKNYECQLCSYKAKNPKYISRHMLRVHKAGPKKHECNICGMKFYFNCKLVDHMRTHTGEKPNKCDVCGKAFSSTYSLATHKFIHTNEKPFKCSFCDYACRDCSTLRKHERRHLGIVKMYKCAQCNNKYDNKTKLGYHVRDKHLNIDETVKCPQCDNTYKNKWTLRCHIKAVHEKALTCVCGICGKEITNRGNLKGHMRSHLELRPFKCRFPGCVKKYKDSGTRGKHEVIHYPQKQFECDICGRRFARKPRLILHLRQHEPKKKKLPCPHCGVRFYNNNYLKRHIFVKHGKRKKKFICDLCDFETTNKPSLVMHIKHGHASARDKECTICKKTYKKNVYLKLHYLNTHQIRYKTKAGQLPMVEIKEEPIDIEPDLEIDLFDIDKEEPFEGFEEDLTEELLQEAQLVNLSHETTESKGDNEKQHNTTVNDSNKLAETSKEDIKRSENETNMVSNEEDIENPEIETNTDTIAQTDVGNTETETIAETDVGKSEIETDTITIAQTDVGHSEMERDTETIAQREVENPEIDSNTETIAQRDVVNAEIANTEIMTQRQSGDSEKDINNKSIPTGTSNYPLNPEGTSTRLRAKPKRRAMEVGEFLQRVIAQAESKDDDNELETEEYVTRRIKELIEQSNLKNGYVAPTSHKDGKFIRRFSESEMTETQPSKKTKIDNLKRDGPRIEKTDQRTKDSKTKKSKKKRKHAQYKIKDVNNKANRKIKKKSKRDDNTNEEGNSSNKSQSEKDSNKGTNTNNDSPYKLIFDSHQCYVCFKVFRTKPELIEHCKQHFDVCNEFTLKKCPLCPFVTKLNIKRHLQLAHNTDISFSFMRIKDRKENANGSRYYFEVKSDKIKELEIIPSIKILNKKASMEIDRKNRELKDKTIAKRKLVKKGDEWIVESEKLDVSDCLVPTKEKIDDDKYIETMKKLSIEARKNGVKMLYPCNKCEKICQNLSALTLHSRRHDPNAKPFKPKGWKRKEQKVSENQNEPVSTENRTADPKPIVHKHKCDPKLKAFYEKNIKGGDIEFWQFLKIYNKMGRENVNDFIDLETRTDFGMHSINDRVNAENKEDTHKEDSNKKNNKEIYNETAALEVKTIKNVKKTKLPKPKYTRKLVLSKTEQKKRVEALNKLREKIAKESNLNVVSEPSNIE